MGSFGMRKEDYLRVPALFIYTQKSKHVITMCERTPVMAIKVVSHSIGMYFKERQNVRTYLTGFSN